MARYFFDLTDGCATDPDEYGLDLESDEVAIREAIAGARSILADADHTGKCYRACAIEIRSEDGRPVSYIPFKQAIRPVVLPQSP